MTTPAATDMPPTCPTQATEYFREAKAAANTNMDSVDGDGGASLLVASSALGRGLREQKKNPEAEIELRIAAALVAAGGSVSSDSWWKRFPLLWRKPKPEEVERQQRSRSRFAEGAAAALNSLARLLRDVGRGPEAEKLASEALDLCRVRLLLPFFMHLS